MFGETALFLLRVVGFAGFLWLVPSPVPRLKVLPDAPEVAAPDPIR